MSSPSQSAPLLVNGVQSPPAQLDVPEAQLDVLEAQPDVPEAQAGVLEAQAGVPDALPAVLEAQPGVPDAQPDVAEALPAVLEAQPGVPDVQLDVAEAQPDVAEALLAVPEAQSPAQPALAAQNDMPAQPNVPAVPEALPAGPEAPPAVPTTHARAPVPVAPVNGESVPHAEHDQPIQPAPPQPTPAPRRTLFLSQAQLLEAQEMFRTANRVTRPEKAFILGFIAGSRASPNPELGHIISIKLSDNHENVMQSDDTFITMVAEIHFQMNFSTGQWCRVKRYRPLEGAVPQKIMPGFPINQNGN